MSQIAAFVDPEMLKVYNLEYDSWKTIYFQRTTVIVTELVLLYALHLYVVLYIKCTCINGLPDSYKPLRLLINVPPMQQLFRYFCHLDS